MRTILFAFAFLMTEAPVFGQSGCPKSTKTGIHVVQQGENLYRISKKYGVTVGEICAWNQISEKTIIPKCAELYVAAPKTAATRPSAAPALPSAAPVDGSAESSVIRQQSPETQAPATERASAAPSGFLKKILPAETLSGDDVHVVVEGETIEDIAAKYGYRTWRFREINGLNASEEVEPGRILRNSECAGSGRIKPISGSSGSLNPGLQNAGSAAPSNFESQKGTVVESEGIRSQTTKVKTEAEKAAEAAAEKANAAKPSTRTDANFMTVNERTMVDEINLMRGNPQGYIPYVEAYIEDQKKNGEFGNSIATARELIAELRNTPRLSILQPSECVYRAAKKHGQQQAKTGSIEHQGTDGSWPWDRVLRECPGYEDGNENLVGGYTDVRKSVIILLVDDGIDNRGHRRTLLEPKWKYVACYEIGPVPPYADYWVQNFGN